MPTCTVKGGSLEEKRKGLKKKEKSFIMSVRVQTCRKVVDVFVWKTCPVTPASFTQQR